jgi:hypothetical protein
MEKASGVITSKNISLLLSYPHIILIGIVYGTSNKIERSRKKATVKRI